MENVEIDKKMHLRGLVITATIGHFRDESFSQSLALVLTT